MKTILSALVLGVCALSLHAAASEPADSIFEADPYFILMGEADAAIAEANWDQAAARLRDAIAVKPDDPSNVLLLNNLATVYTYLDCDSLAIATYNEGLAKAPNMLTLILGRGRALLSAGRDADAMLDFSRAIEIDSLNTDARYYHGMLAMYSGNLTTAEDDFAVLESVAPKATDTYIALSTLYSLSGRDRQAIPYLEGLIAVDPAAEYYATLAGCRLAVGDLQEASTTIADGLQKYPADPELYYYRAWLNRERYMLEDARADAARAIALGANPKRVEELFKRK